MNKLLISFIMFICSINCLAFDSSTTYIPYYYSLIQFRYSDNDSVWVESKQLLNGIMSRDSTFSIIVLNEVVDSDKVLSIKRKKRIAGWTTTATILSGISTVLSPLYNKHNFYLYAAQLQTTYHSATLAYFLNKRVEKEESLKIQYRIDNFSNKELLITDMARGLSWFMRPKSYLLMNVSNPDCTDLRVQTVDASCPTPKYISIVAASLATKEDIAYQNEDFWFIEHFTEGIVPELDSYIKVNKVTFDKQIFSTKDGKALLKQLKQK